MEVGDKVVIMNDIYEPKYERTDGVITAVRPNLFPGTWGTEFRIERWDGTFSYYFKKHLKTYDDYYKIDTLDKKENQFKAIREPDLPPVPEEIACNHRDKYINYVSSTCKFWVCPNCKMDLGDA